MGWRRHCRRCFVVDEHLNQALDAVKAGLDRFGSLVQPVDPPPLRLVVAIHGTLSFHRPDEQPSGPESHVTDGV